jgi:tRNA modification GTPase
MDLVEAEGLGDLLWAQTSSQRQQALSQMLGEASSVFESWRNQLLSIRASIEAAVDFADEHGVAAAAQQDIDGRIQVLLSEMERAVSRSLAASAIRDGVKVVLAGLPNTGKSSLLNVLVGRQAAIVSATPGTTRDAIEVLLDLSGIPVVLTDTAGLRDDDADDIEAEGIRRSRARLAEAHVVVWVASPDVAGSEEYGQERHPDILLSNKCDIVESESRLLRNEDSIRPRFAISAATNEGVDSFLSRLTDLVRNRFTGRENPVVVSERQRLVTLEAVSSLKSAIGHDVRALELKAEDVRRATNSVGRLTGRVDVEEWLGLIFSRFCIGK